MRTFTGLKFAQLTIAGLLATVLCAAASAQAPGTGAISGVVYDPSSRVVVHAHVLVTNDATQVSRSLMTTADGVFRVPLLRPGTYTATVDVAGFAVNTSRDIQVTVGETASLNVTLKLAGVVASVQVESDAEIAQTESSTLGRAVNRTAIEALPLSNRNYTQILGLSPGVLVPLPDPAALGRGSQNVTSNGAKTTANNIQFNGIDANNISSNSAANNGNVVGTPIPTPDAIEEFKVQTANYDASYGHGSGANVDLVSKTGTNRLHGSVWEFVRNNLFNANDFFLKNEGQPRPTLKQNLFGASAGGPMVKDRTFYFVAYQGLFSSNGLGNKTTTLLPLLTSDRSAATLGAQFCPAGHPNHVGYMTHAGGAQVACDGSNINPVALAILNAKVANGQYAVPSPQVALTNANPAQLPVGQSTFAIPASYQENQFSINVDHTLNARNTLAARSFYSRAPTSQPFSPSAATVPGWGTNELDRNTSLVLADTHVFNSNLVNVARFGYMRFDGISAIQESLPASALGEGTPTGPALPNSPAPGLTVDGLFTIGDAGTPDQWEVTNAYVWQDTISVIRGRQSWHFGAEVRLNLVDTDLPFSVDGLVSTITFDDFLLGQSAAQNGSPIGASNIDFSNGASGSHRKDVRYMNYSGFAQDDIRLTPRLTLNAGVRYEIYGPPTDKKGRLTNFDPGIASGAIPAFGSFSGYTVPFNFPGQVPNGIARTRYSSLWTPSYTDFSPRLGFALQLTQRPTLLLRGGYGIYFDQHSGSYLNNTLGQQPFSTQTFLEGSPNGGATLQNPFDPLLPLDSSYPIFIPRVPGGTPFVEAVAPHMRDPSTQEYNLNVQYAFGRDFLLETGYVGSRSINRPLFLSFNQALLASPANPVNGATTNSNADILQRLPFAGVSPGSLLSESLFPANYNSLQSSLTRRLSHGFQFLTSYTWSKILDDTSGSGGSAPDELWVLANDNSHPHQSYGLTDFDRSQRLVMNFTYEAPKFTELPKAARLALNGWQLSGIAVVQAGSPITVQDGNAGSVYGNISNRAQRNPGTNPSTSGSLFSRVQGYYLNGAAFTRAPEAPNGTGLADQDFGNSSVGLVRGPGQHNLDMAMERAFPVTDTSGFRFRVEFFNLTNTPQFANPGNNLGYGDPSAPNSSPSPSFGKITSTVTSPRIIQLALKYAF